MGILVADLCANCGTALAGRFCAQCGQDAVAVRCPFGALVAHAVDEFIGFDNRTLRTLRLLLTQPGVLTREYIAGRQQPYVPALRLYFFIAVGFFIVLSMSGLAIIQLIPYQPGIDPPGSYVSVENSSGEVGARVLWFRHLQSVTLNDQQKSALEKMRQNLEAQGNVASALIGDHLIRLFVRAYADNAAFNAGVQTWTSRFLLLMMPIFALMVAASRPGKFYFIDHLTFALHFHAFLFIAMLAVAGFSFFATGRWLTVPTIAALGFYLFLALRQAYGLSLLAAGWRTFLLLVIYAAIFVYGFEFTILMTMSA